jgi:hypothetical protein
MDSHLVNVVCCAIAQVPVSRLSVLIDMADMQAIHQQASVLEAAARVKHSSPSPGTLSFVLICTSLHAQ